jgi:NMD protein affecting ribosome stability and mRNA decay
MDALIKDVQALLSRKEEEVRENEKKHWLEGMCCTNCGGNKNPDGLSDMCGKCFEEA